MSKIKVDVMVLNEKIKTQMPEYGSIGSAGLDLRAVIDEPLTLQPNQVKLVGSGLAIYLDNPGYVGMLIPRSGLGHKQGIVLGNLVGVIDSDYQGELKMSLWNRSQEPQTIQPFDRVTQYVVVPVVQLELNVVDKFVSATERGEGGFNSTGQK